jgi:hypothetical protein
LLKLSVRFFFGNVKFNLNVRCKKKLTLRLVSQRLLPCARKFIEWNLCMTNSVKNKKR